MSRFVTFLFHTVPFGRLVRAALGVLVCALSLLAVSGEMPASAAPAVLSVAAVAPAHASDRAAVVSMHADGATLDLDDLSGDGRSSGLARSLLDSPNASLGRRHADDDRPGEIGPCLPERPPRG